MAENHTVFSTTPLTFNQELEQQQCSPDRVGDRTEGSVMPHIGHIASAELSILPHCVKINLRGNAKDSSFCAAIEHITDLALPLVPNTVNSGETGSLLWLGPDEWQWRVSKQLPNCVSDQFADQFVEKKVGALTTELANVHSAIVDVSDYNTLLCLRGPQTFSVLEKGTPLHVRQALATPTQCAQTRIGNAAVLLNRTDVMADLVTGASPTIPGLSVWLQVRWSYTEYLWAYLAQAMLEYKP